MYVHHCLRVSSDGLVNGPLLNDPEKLVECKNSNAIRTMDLMDPVMQKKAFCSASQNKSLHFNHTQKYFYQVQAALYCTGCKWCDFVVQTTTDIHIECVWPLGKHSDSERKKLKGKSTSEKWQQTDAITLLSKNQSPASYKEIFFKTPEHISSTIKIMEERKHSPNLRTFSGTRIVWPLSIANFFS